MRNAVVWSGISSLVLLFALQGACGNNGGTLGGGSSGGVSGIGGNSAGQGGNGGGILVSIPPGSNGGASGAAGVSGTGGTAVPSTAGNCGSVTSKADRVPADVLLVQDASGSMTWSIAQDCDCQGSRNSSTPPCQDRTNCVDRWSTLKSAVSAAVTANNGINWGLELFADPKDQSSQQCSVAAIPQVPIGNNTAAAIQQVLASVTPKSSTPTASAIKNATTYLKTVSDSNKKAILLATDGEPNCGGGQSNITDLPNTLAAIKAAADAGFPVYVVGIGPSVGNLDSMAQNGGTSTYYPASSPQQLNDALAAISKVVASCSFTSTTPPPDLSLVYVYVDKQIVPKDASNGWAFGADNSTIVLHGSVCDAVMAGTSKLVEIVFGCPGIAPSEVIP